MKASLRAAASADIVSAVSYYRDQAGPETAVDFVDQLEAAIEHLRRHPLIRGGTGTEPLAQSRSEGRVVDPTEPNRLSETEHIVAFRPATSAKKTARR